MTPFARSAIVAADARPDPQTVVDRGPDAVAGAARLVRADRHREIFHRCHGIPAGAVGDNVVSHFDADLACQRLNPVLQLLVSARWGRIPAGVIWRFANRRGGDFVFWGSCSAVFQGLGQGFLDLQELGTAVDFKTKHILDKENVDSAFAKG